jgi:hypothetical protein
MIHLLNTKIAGNAKLIIIILIFVGALAYAFCAMRGFVYDNEYSRTLSFHSLKLDKSKVYLFVKDYRATTSQDTVIIPMSRSNLPDSLCALYYNGEWKLKLTDNLRKSHKDNTKETILYPFCRLNEKKKDYDDTDFFHNTTKTPVQNDLLTGVRFNNASGRDAFVVKIEEQDENYFLTKGVTLFANRNVPVSNRRQEVFELDFCINGDTLSNSKFIFSFPFLGSQNQPERKNIVIKNDQINYNGSFQPIGSDSFTFSINDCVFRLKNNYSTSAKDFILPTLFLVLIVFNILMLIQLYVLTNKTQMPKQRNLIKMEQFNVLSLRILFNCIILLGFPILLLKTQEPENRLLPIFLLTICLNINWICILKCFAKIIRRYYEIFLILSFIVIALTTIATCFTSNELVFGIPVLKVTTIIVVFLPFAVSCFPGLLKISLMDRIKKRVLTGEGQTNGTTNDKSEHKFAFYLICYSVLIIWVLIITLFFSKDFATLIFTLLSFFLIMITNRKRFWNFIKTAARKEWVYTALFLIIALVLSYSYISRNIDEKKYRFQSSWFFPDNEERFSEFPNIEGSRETIAEQIFLLNAVESGLNPNFNTVILPECRSVFFSDYAVLWSFKIGGWVWFLLYISVLLMLSYTVISLLIIFGKPIKLKKGKRAFYDHRVIWGLNLLLAMMLVQYIYTFLTNFWTIPLTGQSPGLLSPSVYEYLFHLFLLNYLYAYLTCSVQNRQNEIRKDKDTSSLIPSYIQAKFNSFVFPCVICAGSIVFLFYQRCRIIDYMQANGNKMSWNIMQEYDLDSLSHLDKDTLLVLAHKSFEKMESDADEKRKFRNYLSAYYQSDNAKKKHYIDIAYIRNNTNIDSLAMNKQITDSKGIIRGNAKYVNGSPAIFVNNKYYGGCPPDAETVDFDLQAQLNRILENWAVKIDSKRGFKLVGGSILVAENESGYIRSSASYPLMYNENMYHILYENKRINDVLQDYQVGAIPEYLKIRYDNSGYINFAEADMLPGSIVKPLLAYSGLRFLPNKYSQSWLNDFLGWSRNKKAEEMFTNLFLAGTYFDAAKDIYKTDFGFVPYTSDYTKLSEVPTRTHAVGQYQKLKFKNIVQAYMRIKTGRKIELSYKDKEHSGFALLSLDSKKLNKLRGAMCALRNGTANQVGKVLKSEGIDYSNFLAKTGTAQISKSTNYNRTSAIIIVGDSVTVGIQLYGVVPKNDVGLSAQYLFIDIVKLLIDRNILQ